VWDLDPARAEAAAAELGGRSVEREQALAADLLVTVTPGKEVVLAAGSLQPGQHVSLIGADGPGKAEIALEELLRARLFCDDWGQSSHGGELAAAVEAGRLRREDVTELGAVLDGTAAGRSAGGEITVFDSTGLAIQDLAVALAALERADSLELPKISV
jgi:ornithine cyclodeaminase/alanine dehydrogenase-like protein (mu-crystallin family)